MSLLDEPIPPRPAEFSPYGAPPGVTVDLDAFHAFDAAGRPLRAAWWRTRQIIAPRLLLVHTNGARGEGSLASQRNWANADPSNTHPHYCVNAPQPTKFVPSNRKAIGNYKVADWSIVVETADAGWPTPGDAGGFLYDHAEIVARIIAYESIVADLLGSAMPIEYPDRWDGAGVASHTEPFGYPYWTNVSGKACPGRTKKRQVRDEIMPRARQIRAAWLKPHDLPPEDDMANVAKIRFKGYADQYALIPLGPDTNHRLGLEDQAPLVVSGPGRSQIEGAVGYTLTPMPGE